MIGDIDRRVSRALNGIRQGFRAVLSRVSSGGNVQLAQADALAGEQLQDNELFQHYGFTSNPLPGTMAIVLPLGGKTSHGIVIATEHGSYRLKALAPGEVALYTDEGAKIVLKRGRIIETDCDVFKVNCKIWEVNASDSASFDTPMLNASKQVAAGGKINGNGGLAVKKGQGGGAAATIEGGLAATEDVTAGGISLLNHDHENSVGKPV